MLCSNEQHMHMINNLPCRRTPVRTIRPQSFCGVTGLTRPAAREALNVMADAPRAFTVMLGNDLTERARMLRRLGCGEHYRAAMRR
jgi:hypothetical protein